MRKSIAVIAVIGIACLTAATAFAMCGMCDSGEKKVADAATSTRAVRVNNTICPVTGNAVDMKNPITVEYSGKAYNLCCPACPEIFKSDPEKYSKIAEDQASGISKGE